MKRRKGSSSWVLTDRRLNVLQAAKLLGEDRYFTVEELQKVGAYGHRTSISACLRALLRRAYAQKGPKRGYWRITPVCFHVAGMVPAKTQPRKDDRHELPDQGGAQRAPA